MIHSGDTTATTTTNENEPEKIQWTKSNDMPKTKKKEPIFHTENKKQQQENDTHIVYMWLCVWNLL